MQTQEKPVFLTDGVVSLRPVLKSDLNFAMCAMNDPDVRHFIGSYLPQTEEDEEEWIKRVTKNKDKDIVFMIEALGETIGIMGIHRISWKDHVGTTGAVIKSKDNRGKGYGTRAKMLLLYYAFDELNLRRICSVAFAFNQASLGFNRKCGYKQEGVMKKHIFKSGDYHDCILTAVFREDFYPLWEAHKEKYGIVL